MPKHYPIVGRSIRFRNKRIFKGAGYAPKKKDYEAEAENQKIAEEALKAVQASEGRGVKRRFKPLSYKF